MVLYALLVFFAPLVAAVAGNGVDTQIAIWFPNPCDSFGNLPKSLQRAFLQYKEQNNVVNLDSIDAYRRYTVASIEPEATDTWGWNKRDATPTVTSAYNTAGCSTYYPPPTTGNLHPTGSATAAVTNSMRPPATTLTTSKTETPPTNVPSEGRKTTGPSTTTFESPSITSTSTTTSTTTSAPPTRMSSQQSQTLEQSTTASTPSTTRTGELPTGTHSLKPVPNNIKPWCWPKDDTNKKLNVDKNWVYKSITEACHILQTWPPISSDTWWPNETGFIDKDRQVRLNLMLQSKPGLKPLAMAPGSEDGYKACCVNFQYTWDACTGTSLMGGVLLYDDIDWTVSITPN